MTLVSLVHVPLVLTLVACVSLVALVTCLRLLETVVCPRHCEGGGFYVLRVADHGVPYSKVLMVCCALLCPCVLNLECAIIKGSFHLRQGHPPNCLLNVLESY